MRNLFLCLLVLLGGLAWWQRDWLKHQIQPPPAEHTVYTWRDASGHVHYSETPDAPNAKRVALKPLQTLPAAHPPTTPAANKPPAAPAPEQCNEDDPVAQARCINAQETQHNLVIDRMTQALDK